MQLLCTHVDPLGSDGGSHSEATWVSFNRGCTARKCTVETVHTCMLTSISSQRCICVKKCVCGPPKAFKIV